MNIQVKPGKPEEVTTDVLILGGYQDETEPMASVHSLDRRLGGLLTELRRSHEFEGKLNQTALVHTRGAIPAKRILLVGLGKKDKLGLDHVRQAMGTAIKRIRQIGAPSGAAVLLGVDQLASSIVAIAQAMVEGALLGSYRFTAYRTEPSDNDKTVKRLTLLVEDSGHLADAKEGVRRGHVAGEATAYVRDLCNHPANVMTPTRMVAEAKSVAKERGVRLTVLDRRQQEKLGMGGLLGVARGSHEPPQFIILEYTGAPKKERPIVLVGKTVTFDSGGISLKPSENMEQMKADMTGGAEVLATVRAAARLQLPLHVIGILPATENMPGGRAMKPGDILTMLSGKTVEVQNTDAEGRLILADGLAYATRLKPACIVDVATLTGACMVALGQFAIGMLGNDEPLKSQLKTAGEQSGERVWEMPLWDEYFEQLKSDVADMRNIGGRPAGMITAAMFLSKFVEEYPWVHLDIASTDWSTTERPYIGKGPTGIGTRLLIQYLLNCVDEKGR
ncbi:MAG: leucyl aminopeptidase [Nitrospirae bacterium]|nr:MAG: leucyl aminopeptidase [Nitrospirota bacterium]